MASHTHLFYLLALIVLILLPQGSKGSWDELNSNEQSDLDEFMAEIAEVSDVTLQPDNEPEAVDLIFDPEIKGETEVKTEPLDTEPVSSVYDDPKYMPKIEVYGDDDSMTRSKIDCTDIRFIDTIDCLLAREDANLSNTGLKAKQQLLGFQELQREKRQTNTQAGDETVFDEGSGNGNIYPPSVDITNGTYLMESSISFNVTVITNSTEQQLEDQLISVFQNVTGIVSVNVTDVSIVNGTLVATYEVVLSGHDISGYGSNETDIRDSLVDTLGNVTKPLYDAITIDGHNPINPFNELAFADTVIDKVDDICNSIEKCPSNFADCVKTEFDRGTCLHRCEIFENRGVCEHGGKCELDENQEARCSCSNNWQGTRCQEAITSPVLDNGEIAGATIGAIVVVIGILGMVAWMCLCRKGTKNINMTHYSDDSGGSDRFTNPSSKISTFVVDRPRISASPVNAFNPGHTSSHYPKPRAKASLFSDA